MSIFGLLVLSVPAYATPYVQGFCQTQGGCGGGACVVNLPLSGIVSGDWILWSALTNQTNGIIVSGSGTPHIVQTSTANGFTQIVGYTTGASGSATITFTDTAGSSFRIEGCVHEFNSILGFDVSSAWNAPGSTQTSITTNSATTTLNGDVCYTPSFDGNTASGSQSAASPFTTITGDSNTNTVFNFRSAYYVQPAAGALTLTWSSFGAGAQPATVMECFKPSGYNSIMQRRR